MRLQAGTRIGHYEIGDPIGSGGMGAVYRARDTRLDRTVAIKILEQPTSDFRRRFAREAKAIAALQHPYICTLHDVGKITTPKKGTLNLTVTVDNVAINYQHLA
jgi:serine/threonine protein kinase